MNEKTQLQLTGESLLLVLSGFENPKEVVDKLLVLAPAQRALAIGFSFESAMNSVNPKEASDAGERFGKKLERVLDEMPDNEIRETFSALIEEGDVELVMNMIKGNAADISTCAAYLDADLINELFEKDPEMDPTNDLVLVNTRIIYLCWTLLESKCRGLGDFFGDIEEKYPIAQMILERLKKMKNSGNEEASVILRRIAEIIENHKEKTEEIEENKE